MFRLNFSVLCSLLCICAIAEMSENQWKLESKPKYIFLYGYVDFWRVSNIIGAPIEELLTKKRVIAVEARGWKRRFAGALKENGRLHCTRQLHPDHLSSQRLPRRRLEGHGAAEGHQDEGAEGPSQEEGLPEGARECGAVQQGQWRATM